jgi:hypothetical protein
MCLVIVLHPQQVSLIKLTLFLQMMVRDQLSELQIGRFCLAGVVIRLQSACTFRRTQD